MQYLSKKAVHGKYNPQMWRQLFYVLYKSTSWTKAGWLLEHIPRIAHGIENCSFSILVHVLVLVFVLFPVPVPVQLVSRSTHSKTVKCTNLLKTGFSIRLIISILLICHLDITCLTQVPNFYRNRKQKIYYKFVIFFFFYFEYFNKNICRKLNNKID